ncbi:hypothetical protein [Dinoroseobacter sp. S124A]|uniref:hypothetical protein n=1 Tax=Dinoroseobacter sp. S124A TaxID=3415128 RepID=UPI003C7D4807
MRDGKGQAMGWWTKHASGIEAMAALVTACVAIAALVGAKIQLDHADLVQREQSARDAYRAHLALAATRPEFARPIDACQLVQSDEGGAYIAFVDHLLYSAEQMLAVEEGWSLTFLDQLAPHQDYLCSLEGILPLEDGVAALMDRFTDAYCPVEPVCGPGG